MSLLMALFLLSLVVFLINFIPAFMPATWMVLVFAYIQYQLPFGEVIILGALFSTFGRVALYYLSEKQILHYLPKEAKGNFEELGTLLNKRKHITVPFTFLFAFLPVPSNHIFIGAGLAHYDLKILSIGFFLGRILNYSLLVGSSTLIAISLNSLLKSSFTGFTTVILEICGFASLFLISKIGWNKVFAKIPG